MTNIILKIFILRLEGSICKNFVIFFSWKKCNSKNISLRFDDFIVCVGFHFWRYRKETFILVHPDFCDSLGLWQKYYYEVTTMRQTWSEVDYYYNHCYLMIVWRLTSGALFHPLFFASACTPRSALFTWNHRIRRCLTKYSKADKTREAHALVRKPWHQSGKGFEDVEIIRRPAPKWEPVVHMLHITTDRKTR